MVFCRKIRQEIVPAVGILPTRQLKRWGNGASAAPKDEVAAEPTDEHERPLSWLTIQP